MRINICLISDENFIQHLAVTIASILSNANNDDDLYFYLLLSKNVLETDKQKILSLKKIKNCNINFIDVNISTFKNYALKKRAANFKFFLGDILKDLDKVLYLDCDLVVLTSLKDLFSENIDNYYIAAVEDAGYYGLKKINNYFVTDFYINSGVMLINLKLWRQNNLKEKFIEIKEKNIKKFKFIDQDTINYCCKNKIKSIPFNWNIQREQINIIGKFINHPNKKQMKISMTNPKIIHYTSPDKPWKTYAPLMKYYFKYLKLTNFKNKLNLFKLSIDYTKNILINFIFFIRFLLLPIIEIQRENNSIKFRIFYYFVFYL